MNDAARARRSPLLIEARNVSRTFPDGNVRALIDVDFAVRRGEFVAIMGPSGSGKSTLLNMLGALDTPDKGEIFFEDRPLASYAGLARYRAHEIGFVFQSFFLLPTLTAIENVQMPMFEGPLRPAQRAEKAGELLAAVGVSHRAKHLPSKLSVGERQRVAIARALANDAPLLLSDEPTGNLDTRTAEGILNLFRELHEERGKTLVMVTHSEEVAHRARRLVRMCDGRIDDDGPVSEPRAALHLASQSA